MPYQSVSLLNSEVRKGLLGHARPVKMFGKKIRIQLGLVILVAIFLVLASQGWMLRKGPNSATPLSVFPQATETGHTLPREPLFHYSGYQPDAHVKDGPLDAYADKMFMMLKTGATVTQSRLPPHT